MNKLTTYKLLRHLPGRLGRRYSRKLFLRTNGFEKAIRRSEGKVCIDLGANLGVFTRVMAQGTKTVIAFEPDPWTHANLLANVSDLDNVTVKNAAAGTAEGTYSLYRHHRFEENPVLYSESSSLIPEKSNVSEIRSVEIRQVDFISYLQSLDEDIGVLKIDIEGAEVDLLEALFDRPDLLERIDYIFAETHERKIPSHAARVKALRKRADATERPNINLYWR